MNTIKRAFASLHFLSEYAHYITGHRERQAEFRRLAAGRRRERIFIVGNGPSLNEIDLSCLEDEDYFLCNHADRIDWVKGRQHPFYIAADKRAINGYAGGAPTVEADVYFLEEEFKPLLPVGFTEKARIIWFTRARGGTQKRGFSPRPWISIAGGQTVLLSATQIALFMGYSEIYILGCDLNYSTPAPYAYAVSEDEFRAARRDEEKMIQNTNLGFARLRAGSERRGQRIFNAGSGGNLEALARIRFEDIFKAD
ncbi:hypothetical protein [Martelella mangrovi]|uniref:DUF115 domain-containing protein n=1 Tax=Martelella mangrovi TaxID=1397477 RepID=A0ABV2IF38_9HYPH